MSVETQNIQILLPAPLRRFAAGEKRIALRANNVREALQALANAHPALAPHLLTPHGEAQAFLRLYLGDEDVAVLQGGNTVLKDGDELSIVPAIAGGSNQSDTTREAGLPSPSQSSSLVPSQGQAMPQVNSRSGSQSEGERQAALAANFSKAELERYSRHLIIPEFNTEGQAKLKAAKVLVVGTGGLGAPLLQYLAAAGVGTLGILDFDTVEDHNLQRQVLFGGADVGRSKVAAAADRIRALNPYIELRTHELLLTSENALDIIAEYDLVADGTDNFPTRYLVNDACVLLGKTNVYASIFRFDGQVSVFNRLRPDGSRGPNYRDLFPAPPPPDLVPSCSEGGVIGVLPGILGSLQANEVLKVLSGYGEPLDGRLLMVDAASMEFRTLNLHANPTNPLTGENPTQNGLVDYAAFCGIPLPDPANASESISEDNKALASTAEDAVPGISPELLAKRRAGAQPPLVVDVREPYEYAIANIDGLLIPVSEVEERLAEIPRNRPVVLHCRSGKRSADVLKRLRKGHGYQNLLNLEGGILAWARTQDAGMAMY